MNNQTQQIITQNTYEIIDISNLYHDSDIKMLIKAEQQGNNILILFQLVTPLQYKGRIYHYELQYKCTDTEIKTHDNVTYWNEKQIDIDLQLFENFKLYF